MPTYAYTCSACGKEMEISHKISDVPLSTCPHCASASLKRGVGGGSAVLRFQGSGFYVNDYASPNPESDSGCGCGKSSCTR